MKPPEDHGQSAVEMKDWRRVCPLATLTYILYNQKSLRNMRVLIKFQQSSDLMLVDG